MRIMGADWLKLMSTAAPSPLRSEPANSQLSVLTGLPAASLNEWGSL